MAAMACSLLWWSAGCQSRPLHSAFPLRPFRHHADALMFQVLVVEGTELDCSEMDCIAPVDLERLYFGPTGEVATSRDQSCWHLPLFVQSQSSSWPSSHALGCVMPLVPCGPPGRYNENSSSPPFLIQPCKGPPSDVISDLTSARYLKRPVFLNSP